jgi:general secretion pathway protein J
MRASNAGRLRRAGATHQPGFTLVELLVALMVMALLAVMSWQGLDGMARANAQTRQRADALMALQSGFAQWAADLDAMVAMPQRNDATAAPAPMSTTDVASPLDWNGQALRLVRTDSGAADAGLRVVAWSRREVSGKPQWLRWQSDLVRDSVALQSAWLQAAVWAQNPGDAERRREVAITPLAGWQVFYFRNDAWSNPLSSAGATPAAPDGVRLVLTLPQGEVLAGTLTRDWVRPTVAGNKS